MLTATPPVGAEAGKRTYARLRTPVAVGTGPKPSLMSKDGTTGGKTTMTLDVVLNIVVPAAPVMAGTLIVPLPLAPVTVAVPVTVVPLFRIVSAATVNDGAAVVGVKVVSAA